MEKITDSIKEEIFTKVANAARIENFDGVEAYVKQTMQRALQNKSPQAKLEAIKDFMQFVRDKVPLAKNLVIAILMRGKIKTQPIPKFFISAGYAIWGSNILAWSLKDDPQQLLILLDIIPDTTRDTAAFDVEIAPPAAIEPSNKTAAPEVIPDQPIHVKIETPNTSANLKTRIENLLKKTSRGNEDQK